MKFLYEKSWKIGKKMEIQIIEEEYGCIYCLTNSINNKQYYGQTTSENFIFFCFC